MILVIKKVGFHIQMQILDFLGKITLRLTRKSTFTKGEARKRKKDGWLKKITSEIARGVQKTLDMFTIVLSKVKKGVSKYVPHFKTPKATTYIGDKLAEIEKISYQRITSYWGEIRHLFHFHCIIKYNYLLLKTLLLFKQIKDRAIARPSSSQNGT